jgi:hypothetical protein
MLIPRHEEYPQLGLKTVQNIKVLDLSGDCYLMPEGSEALVRRLATPPGFPYLYLADFLGYGRVVLCEDRLERYFSLTDEDRVALNLFYT